MLDIILHSYDWDASIAYLASMLNSLVTLPTVLLRSRVGFIEQVGHVWKHCVEDSRIHRAGGLHVQVNWSSNVLDCSCFETQRI